MEIETVKEKYQYNILEFEQIKERYLEHIQNKSIPAKDISYQLQEDFRSLADYLTDVTHLISSITSFWRKPESRNWRGCYTPSLVN
jgi:hypothetical protein